jgi:hypothetical protein
MQAAVAADAAVEEAELHISEEFVTAWLQLRGLQLKHIAAAAVCNEVDEHLDYCSLCGESGGRQSPLVCCDRCCHCFHKRCAFALDLEKTGRSGLCIGCQGFPVEMPAAEAMRGAAATAPAPRRRAAAAAAEPAGEAMGGGGQQQPPPLHLAEGQLRQQQQTQQQQQQQRHQRQQLCKLHCLQRTGQVEFPKAGRHLQLQQQQRLQQQQQL